MSREPLDRIVQAFLSTAGSLRFGQFLTLASGDPFIVEDVRLAELCEELAARHPGAAAETGPIPDRLLKQPLREEE